MPTIQELQMKVDAAFPHAAKVISPTGSVYLAPYLTVVDETHLVWIPTAGTTHWITLSADLAKLDWSKETIDLDGGYRLNHNFDFSNFPDSRLALAKERSLIKDHWSDWLRSDFVAEKVAA